MRIAQFEDGGIADLPVAAQPFALLCGYLAAAYIGVSSQVIDVADEELESMSQEDREAKVALAGASGALEEVMEKFGERGFPMLLPRSIVEQLSPFYSTEVVSQKPLLVGPNGNA